jgi:hypothetical protein
MTSRILLVAVTMTVGVLSWAGADKFLNHDGRKDRRVSSRPELEYLKAVNSAAPPQDPQLLFLLMGEFANANRQEEGAELNWNSVLNYKTGISGIFAPAEQLQSATKEVRLISLPVSFLQFNNVSVPCHL